MSIFHRTGTVLEFRAGALGEEGSDVRRVRALRGSPPPGKSAAQSRRRPPPSALPLPGESVDAPRVRRAPPARPHPGGSRSTATATSASPEPRPALPRSRPRQPGVGGDPADRGPVVALAAVPVRILVPASVRSFESVLRAGAGEPGAPRPRAPVRAPRAGSRRKPGLRHAPRPHRRAGKALAAQERLAGLLTAGFPLRRSTARSASTSLDPRDRRVTAEIVTQPARTSARGTCSRVK